jgi:hypothetical protein
MLDGELAKSFLKEIYPKLRLNYKWFRRTQWGEIKEWGRKAKSKEAYRWRGRTPGHTLTSGMQIKFLFAKWHNIIYFLLNFNRT